MVDVFLQIARQGCNDLDLTRSEEVCEVFL
jgi:hypothetical protein